jgi:hypothetical protein
MRSRFQRNSNWGLSEGAYRVVPTSSKSNEPAEFTLGRERAPITLTWRRR